MLLIWLGLFINLSVPSDAVVNFLFTSSWYTNASEVNIAKAATIDINDCVKNLGFTQVFITSGISILSTISVLQTENTRLNSLSIGFAYGEPNSYIQFIYSTSTPGLTFIQPMYPNDTEVMVVVLNVFYQLSTNPKSNILVLINRTQNFYNLEINNYQNIIQIINNQNWNSVRFLAYSSVDDVIFNIRSLSIFTIISLLYDPDVNSMLIQRAYLSHLMVWNYRWIIVDLLGGTNVLNNTIYGQGVLTNNVSIITFSQGGYTGRQVLLQSAFSTTIAINCSTAPTGLDSGTFTGSVRSTFKFAIYQNPGKMSVQIGNITYDRNTGIVTLPPNLVARSYVLDLPTSTSYLRTTGFTIGYVEFPPFSMKNGTNYSGFTMDLLTSILNDFNITPTIVPLSISDVGSFSASNFSYSGMLGMVQNGTIDTVSIPIILTIDRLNNFDFAPSVLSGYIAGVYYQQNLTGMNTLINYINPFDWRVWVTLFASALAIAISLAISDYAYPDKYSRYRILMSVFFAVSSLTHGAYFDPPRRVGARIIMCFWWLFALIVVVIWATNYTALLAKTATTPSLSSFYDLLTQNKYNYFSVNDTVLFTYLVDNQYQGPQTIYRIINEETINGTVNNLASAMSMITSSNYVFLYDDKSLSSYTSKYCLSMFGKFVNFEYGLVLPKYSEKTPIITNKVTSRLAQGNITTLINQYLNNQTRNCTQTFIDVITNTVVKWIPNYFFGAFDVDSMIGVFVIVIVGGVATLFLAIIEKLIRSMISSSKRKRDKFKYENTLNQLTEF